MEILEIEEVQTAPKTELAPIERAAIALESSKTEQHLMALATKHQSITVVKDKAGREQAHGAYMESIKEHVEQPLADVAAQVEAKRQAAKQPDPEPAPAVPHLPRAPVASAIVLAVAEFWYTDNKTAARWITERAAEIETLKG